MPTARGDGDPGPRRLLGGADNPLVRAVGRVPATVLTKLLVAFAGTVVLLVVLGVLGLGVISDVERQGRERSATSSSGPRRTVQLQAGVAAIQQVVNLRAGTIPDGPFHDILFQSIFSSPTVGWSPTD